VVKYTFPDLIGSRSANFIAGCENFLSEVLDGDARR